MYSLKLTATSVLPIRLCVQAACQDSTATGADAVNLLSQQYFFTSTKLAGLATEAEILTKV